MEHRLRVEEIPQEFIEHDRFQYFSTVGLSQFGVALSTASAAFDWMEINPSGSWPSLFVS